MSGTGAAGGAVSTKAGELSGMSAVDLVAGYRDGSLSPVEVVQDGLALIEDADSTLHAMERLYPDRALAAARASEQRYRNGAPISPVDGVPATIKENQQVIGDPNQWGSAAVDPVAAQQNSPLVDKLLAAGVPILGRTVMPELGMLSSGLSTLHPMAVNAQNAAWNPGGSTAGGGAAATAGYAPFNFGSDIGGSVRLPASWNGCAGFKPTFGRIPVDPPYFGRHIGPLGRHVADLSLVMTSCTGPDYRDPYSLPAQDLPWTTAAPFDPKGARIGLVLDVGDGAEVDPEVRAAVVAAAGIFEAAGAVVEEIGPYLEPGEINLIDLFWRIGHWNDYRKMDPERRKLMLPFISEWCQAGAGIDGPQAVHSADEQLRMARRTIAVTHPYDIILSPVSPGPTYPAEWPMPSNDVHDPMSHIGFCVVYNMSGQPAVSVNCGYTGDGRPIGLQVAAARYQDVQALSAASFYEANRPADAQRPWPRIWEDAAGSSSTPTD